MPTLNFTVNGNSVSVDVQPNEFLAEVLRYKLGLTGTKIGCNEAERMDICIRCRRTSSSWARCSVASARRV
jgi:aerobic-type carbon monoxide dehydrogenase small subunit (CoxS/CutS family)